MKRIEFLKAITLACGLPAVSRAEIIECHPVPVGFLISSGGWPGGGEYSGTAVQIIEMIEKAGRGGYRMRFFSRGSVSQLWVSCCTVHGIPHVQAGGALPMPNYKRWNHILIPRETTLEGLETVLKTVNNNLPCWIVSV